MKKKAIPKNSKLYNILKGVSLEEINAARGGKSSIFIEVDKNATSIKEISSFETGAAKMQRIGAL